MKKASLSACSGEKPGATSLTRWPEKIMPPAVRTIEAMAIHKKMQEKNCQASSSFFLKQAARMGMMVIDMKPPARR